VSSNARNYNLLNEQIKGQGAEVLSDTTNVGMAFGAPALANAVGLLGTGAQYLNPIQQVQAGSQGMGFVTHTTVSRSLLMKLGQTAASTGSSTGSGIAATIVGGKLTGDAQTRHSLARGERANVRVPANKYDARRPRGPEPEWLRKARKSEQETLGAAIDSLIAVHQAKIARFSDRTQALMQKALQTQTTASKAAAIATPKEDPDGSAQHAEKVSRMLAELTTVVTSGTSPLKSGLKQTVKEETPQIAKQDAFEKEALAGVNLSGDDGGAEP
jgi:uncharacterized coiled-coil protein SlyX